MTATTGPFADQQESVVDTATSEVLNLLSKAQIDGAARDAGFERHDLHMLWSALEQLRNHSLLPTQDRVLPVSDLTNREREVLEALSNFVVVRDGRRTLDLAGFDPGHIRLNFRVECHDDSPSSVGSEGTAAVGSTDPAAPIGGESA